MGTGRLTLTTVGIYQDLVRDHLRRALIGYAGKPYVRKISGRDYWYAHKRVGQKVTEVYLGPDTPDLARRIEEAAAMKEEAKKFDQRSGVMVGQLRAASLPSLDRETGKVLAAMSRAGVFRLGGTLVGTHAYRLYAAELGIALPDTAAVTDDIDFAAFENLKLVIHDVVDPKLPEVLLSLGLEPQAGLDHKRRVTTWAMRGGGTSIDFLAPRMTQRQEIVYLAPLGVHAQGLPFLNFLIADPIPAVALYRSGVLVQIPRPERYAVHKMIIAQRRKAAGLAKVSKDLAQAQSLIEALVEDRPAELSAALNLAISKGPAWRKGIAASMKMRPALAALLKAINFDRPV